MTGAGASLGALVRWAARDLARRPARAVLSALALASLVAAVAAPPLAERALDLAEAEAGLGAPAVVVRRLDAFGLAPLQADEATAALRGVAGALDVRARRLGPASTGSGPVTVVGVGPFEAARLEALGLPRPRSGQALAGPALTEARAGSALALEGPGGRRELRVEARLPRGAGLGPAEAVLVSWDEAGGLLGLAPGEATELGVWVFHDAEEEAIRGDLERAAPFAVRLTGRTEAATSLRAERSRRAALLSLWTVPALLALALLVSAGAREEMGLRQEIGLLKALGWTTREVVLLRLARALALGLPALALGLVAALALVSTPATCGPLALGLGAAGRAPDRLAVDPAGLAVALGTAAGLVLLPWLGAALWPALRAATADPSDLLGGEELR